MVQNTNILRDYLKWMEDNHHEIETYWDYGDCGDESIRCRNRDCLAGKYKWDSYHIREYERTLGIELVQD